MMASSLNRLIKRLEDEQGKTVTTEVDLTSYRKDRDTGTSEARYYVKHSNQETVLEQEMVINRDALGKFEASAIFTDFPPQDSEEAAALKLAAWLQRIGEAIEANYRDKVSDA